MSSRPAPPQLEAFRLFLETHSRLHQKLERDLEASHGLSMPMYEVLFRLSQAPEQRLRLNGLVSFTRLTKSGISRLVDRMEAARLIMTESCPSDRRGAFAVLTPEGASLLRRATVTHLRDIKQHFADHLDDGESLEAFVSTLRRVSAALSPPETEAGRPPACGQ